MEAEPSKTKLNQVLVLRKKWFKKFLGISKTTSTLLMNHMLGRDFTAMMSHDATVADRKWEARLRGTTCLTPKLDNGPNLLRGVPQEWSTLVNSTKKPCPRCTNPRPVLSRWHLYRFHQIKLPAIEYIWNHQIIPITINPTIEVQSRYGKPEEKTMPRYMVSNLLYPIIKSHLDDFNKAYQSLIN